tara:strand:- start:731 stop:1873 length:1143 start_codon:yes stop_codon:yes gene_type:complete
MASETALIEKQEAYIRIKKMLNSVDPENFPEMPLGDGDDNDWSYILVWYYTFDKPWLWASQAAKVARSSPLKSKAFREHFTMLKIDSQLDDVGAAFRHLQQSLVGFEKKLAELKSGPDGRQLVTEKEARAIFEPELDDKQELKVKNILQRIKKIKNVENSNVEGALKTQIQKDLEYVTLYQSAFLDDGVIKSSNNRLVQKLEELREKSNEILLKFIEKNNSEETDITEIVYKQNNFRKQNGTVKVESDKELKNLTNVSKDKLNGVKNLMNNISNNRDLGSDDEEKLYREIYKTEYEKMEGAFESLKTSLYYSFVPVLTYLLSSGFTYESIATALGGTAAGAAYNYWNSPQITIYLKVAYLDATAANLHALASFISSYKLK